MKNIIWSLLVGSICSSAMAQDKILYQEEVYNQPERGVETEVYLGDRMLTQQVGEWKECITPKRSYEKTTWGWTGFYKSGEPLCKRTLKDKNYWPTYNNSVNGENSHRQAVSWRGKKGKYRLCQTAAGMAAYCIKDLSENDMKAGATFIYNPNSFQQTIAYDGRNGDVLKFNYAEFSDGFARQSFSREFQIDLSEGSVAAYKGAIIEVLEATNVQIKYKVIRNFASDR